MLLRRKELLRQQIELNPKKAQQYFFDQATRKQISDRTQNSELLEQSISQLGSVKTLIAENFDSNEYWYEHKFYPNEGTQIYYSYFVDPELGALDQNLSQVQISGMAIDNTLLITQTNQSQTLSVPNSLPNNLKIAVIKYEFANLPINQSDSSIEQIVLEDSYSLDRFLRESSFNQLSVDADTFKIYGTYKLPVTQPSDANNNCSYDTYGEIGEAMAIEQDGLNPKDYDLLMLVGPRPNGCNNLASAYGDIRRIQTDEPLKTYFYSSFGYKTVVHEVGHNLSMHHANGISCPNHLGFVFGDNGYLDSSCVESSYGDNYDVMGSGFRQYNAAHRFHLGWYAPNEYSYLSTSQRVELFSPFASDNALKVGLIRVPKKNYVYVLSYRQPDNFFDTGISPDVTSGLQIHTFRQDQNIIKNTEGYSYAVDLQRTKGYNDYGSSMSDGQEYLDTFTDIKITQISHNNQSVIADVEFLNSDECKKNKPTITIDNLPDSIYLNESYSFDVKITNNNSSACPSQEIQLNAAPLQGTEASVSIPNLQLASSETQNFTLSFKVPLTDSNFVNSQTSTYIALAFEDDNSEYFYQIPFQVISRTLNSAEVTPSYLNINSGESKTATLKVYDQGGSDITNSVNIVWQGSSEIRPDTVNELGSEVQVTALSQSTRQGQVNAIITTANGEKLMVPLVVNVLALPKGPVIDSLEIMPAESLSLAVNEEVNLSVKALDSNGEELTDGLSYRWRPLTNYPIVSFKNALSRDTTIKGIDNGFGSVEITVTGEANYLSKQFEVSVGTISEQTPAEVLISPGSNLVLSPGQKVNLSALSYDDQMNPIWSGIYYNWGISSDGSLARIQPNGAIASVEALNEGTGDLWVTVINSNGDTVTKSLSITVAMPATYLEADFNQDGIVDGQDYAILSNAFLLTGSNMESDLNKDSIVDGTDYAILANQFLVIQQ